MITVAFALLELMNIQGGNMYKGYEDEREIFLPHKRLRFAARNYPAAQENDAKVEVLLVQSHCSKQ